MARARASTRPGLERNQSTHGKKKKTPPSAESIREAGKAYAKKTVDQLFAESTIQDHAGTYPKFEPTELSLGKVLGKGGFGTVSEVRSFQVTDQDEKKEEADAEKEQQESRLFIAEHCIRDGGDARYAIKVLSPEVVADPPRYLQGILDMA